MKDNKTNYYYVFRPKIVGVDMRGINITDLQIENGRTVIYFNGEKRLIEQGEFEFTSTVKLTREEALNKIAGTKGYEISRGEFKAEGGLNNKYYTPSIEEFRVGFEYEYLYVNEDVWKRTKCVKSDFRLLEDAIKDKNFRVKYLDSSDIESLGFKYDNNAEPIPSRDDWNIPKTFDYELPLAFLKDTQLIDGKGWFLYLYKDHTVWIEYIKDNCGMGYLFKGKIKNISELKVLLIQLGIEYDK